MRRNAAANRERILEVAGAVFGEYGAAASTEEVARRAEVGIATVFRHFPTKAALIESVLVRHFEALSDLAARLADRPDQGVALGELLQSMAESGPTKLSLAAQLENGGAFPASVAAAAQSLRDHVGRLLAGAQHEGDVRPEVTLDELYLLIRGLAQAAASPSTTRPALHGAIEIILTGLRADLS
jgi:AcrR family transcriptional regulator